MYRALTLYLQVYQPLYNISVPSSAFRDGEGSYSISQFPLANGVQFLLTMSDATGFGSGGTSTVLTVGVPIANNNCNTAVPSPDFYFSPSSSLQQCRYLNLAGPSHVALTYHYS
jgi:hypothetical protein